MTELNHQGITRALAGLHAATTANTAATADTAAAGYATPPGAAPAPAPATPSSRTESGK